MSRNPPRLYNPSRKPGRPPTERQKAARDRNWQIFKLRGLWYQVWMLTGERRVAAQALIDQELELLGAEGVGVRRQRIQDDRDRYERFRDALLNGMDA